MPRGTVIAYHVCFATYGFWLPNDPRGSNSDFVGAAHLLRFGPATKVRDRRSHARDLHNAALRAAAKRALRYPPVVFDGRQARAVARGFARAVQRTGCVIHACAIMPAHVHLVIARHTYDVEQLVRQLKADATRQLIAENLHPLSRYAERGAAPPTCWGRGCRKIFLFTDDDVTNEIDYVHKNPIRAGMKEQRWSFVTPYRPS
jgi:REP element-mobilizing transposase RayT